MSLDESPNHCAAARSLAAEARQRNGVGRMLGHSGSHPLPLIDDLRNVQLQADRVTSVDVANSATVSRVGAAEAHGVATFYSQLEVAQERTSRSATPTVRICDGPSCCLRGSQRVRDDLAGAASSWPKTSRPSITRTSCIGLCDVAPAAICGETVFGRLDSLESVTSLTKAIGGEVDRSVAKPLLQPVSESGPQNSKIGPLTAGFDSTIRNLSASFNGLHASFRLSPSQIADELVKSGLRGRGGAGFLTGVKWKSVAQSIVSRRIVVCNADESEPGTFKDRVLMERDPHRLIEGMAICGRAVGSSEGIVYIRGEYALAARRLQEAIDEARRHRVLGSSILGTDFDFDISIHHGAGAYICGEETALLESLEGRRGEPRTRPPFPSTSGYLGYPTVVNNVETLCAIPFIMQHGADTFRQLGRGRAAGTKLYCLSGHVKNSGVYEAPLGTSVNQLIYDRAGGIRNASECRFVVTGGAAGTFLPTSMFDVPLDYESWNDGVALGSGAVIVADRSVSAVTMLLWILRFFECESCGKCTPCRIGTKQARQIVERIAASDGRPGDIDRLLSLAGTLGLTSFCGLGESVAWPIESSIRHFAADFETLGAT